MNKKYTAIVLLMACVVSTLKCTPYDTFKKSFFSQKSKIALFLKKEKNRTNLEAIAIGAAGVIAGAFLCKASHEYPSSNSYYRSGSPILTQRRVNIAGKVIAVSGCISAILYKRWKTDKKILPTAVQQACNNLRQKLNPSIHPTTLKLVGHSQSTPRL